MNKQLNKILSNKEIITQELKVWLTKMQNLMDSYPGNERLQFYTGGDADLTLYDASTVHAIQDLENLRDNTREEYHISEQYNLELGSIRMPIKVAGLAI